MKQIKALFYFLKTLFPLSRAAMAFSLLSTALKAASPIISLLLCARLLGALAAHAPAKQLLPHILCLIGFSGASGLLLTFMQNRFQTLCARLKDDFTLYVGKKMARLQYGRLESARLQDLRQQALLPILKWGNFEFVLEEFLPAVVGGAITILTTFWLLADYKLWLLLPVLLIAGLQLLLSGLKNARFQKAMACVGPLERKMGYYDAVSGDFSLGKDIRIFRFDRLLLQKIRELNEREVGEFSRLYDRAASLDFWETAAVQAQICFVYMVAAVDLFKRSLPVDSFFRITGLFINFGSALFSVVNAFVNLHTRSRFLLYFMEFDRLPPEPEKSGACRESAQEVEFSHVSFRYPGGEQILSDVSFTIPAGKTIALVGENGSGKTTAAKLLSGFLSPTGGEVRIGKKALCGDSREELSAVYQDFQLFALSVRENIETAYSGRGELPAALDAVGMLSAVQELKNGAETCLYRLFSPDGKDFSYGQLQKLATARALYKNAGVILLDEPTSAFDARAEYEIFRDFQRITEGKTALLISHRLWSCKSCDEILVLSGGKIAERGTHEQLMAVKGGLYRELFLAQAQYYSDIRELSEAAGPAAP